LANNATNYEILKVGDTFAVRVDYPTGSAAIRRGFRNVADAEEWVRQQSMQPVPPSATPPPAEG
jgi:hypothetical protein